MLSKNFYTDLLSLILALFITVIGFYNYRKAGILKLFIWYSLFSFIQSGFTFLLNKYDLWGLKNSIIIELSINAFVMFEAVVFSIFFYKVLNRKSHKLIVLYSTITFFILFLADLIFFKGFLYVPVTLTIIESIIYLSFCVIYFLQLFNEPPTIKLVNNEIFWITNGIFFLFALLVPLFLLKPVFKKVVPYVYDNLYSINFIAYSILFLFLSNALACKLRTQN